MYIELELENCKNKIPVYKEDNINLLKNRIFLYYRFSLNNY
jgi:hypothetical protein